MWRASSLSAASLLPTRVLHGSKLACTSHCRIATKRSRRQRLIKVSVEAVGSNEVCEVALGLPVLPVKGGLETLLSVGVLGAVVWSALPVIASSTDSRKGEWEEKVWENQGKEGTKWGVMTVVSCLPVFNWLAWVFAALQNEERATFYYALAALYAAPQLEAGFHPNFFSLTTLLAGVAHVQIERIAEEREVLREAPQVSQNLRDKPKEAGKLIQDSARSFAEAVDTQERNDDIRKEVVEGKPSKRSDDVQLKQLESWDQRLKDRGKK